MTTRSAFIPMFALAATMAAAAAAHAAPATYMVDPTHTFVTFEARHAGISTNRGRFDKTSGTIVVDKEAKSGKVDIAIDMASINTGTGNFDGHLKSKDFFNVSAFTTATFTSDKLVFDGDKVSGVEGKLTMLGKSQPVTLKGVIYGCYDNPRFKREVCGGDFETTIKRSDFGMSYGLPGIPDEIKLVIQVEAIKQ